MAHNLTRARFSGWKNRRNQACKICVCRINKTFFLMISDVSEVFPKSRFQQKNSKIKKLPHHTTNKNYFLLVLWNKKWIFHFLFYEYRQYSITWENENGLCLYQAHSFLVIFRRNRFWRWPRRTEIDRETGCAFFYIPKCFVSVLLTT